MKKLFVLYTGGTIGMKDSPDGLKPDTSLVQTALSAFNGTARFDWHICNPLIDSSAVTPQDWANWLSLLQNKLPDYDGFLLLHGTDTMAYTANLLALTLDTQGKPLILTGAQKPFGTHRSDAHRNLHTAVNALLTLPVHETLLAFNGKLFPAVGSSKSSTESDEGFTNPHFGQWLPATSRKISGSRNTLPRRFCPKSKVLPLYLTPGAASRAAASLLRHHPADAAILLSYGHGNTPSDHELIQAVSDFTSQGKPLLNISQVPQGCAAAVYAQSSALRKAGAVNGGKCNIETATALMMLAAANHWNTEHIQSELQRLKLII